MQDHIHQRCVRHGLLFIQRDETVRSVAKRTGWSKNTVHIDLTVRLKEVNLDLYEKVEKKLQENKDIRHLKGGYATQDKWVKIKIRRAKKNERNNS